MFHELSFIVSPLLFIPHFGWIPCIFSCFATPSSYDSSDLLLHQKNKNNNTHHQRVLVVAEEEAKAWNVLSCLAQSSSKTSQYMRTFVPQSNHKELDASSFKRLVTSPKLKREKHLHYRGASNQEEGRKVIDMRLVQFDLGWMNGVTKSTKL